MKSQAGLEAPGLGALGLRAPGCNVMAQAVARWHGAETDNKALQAKFELWLGLGVAISWDHDWLGIGLDRTSYVRRKFQI